MRKMESETSLNLVRWHIDRYDRLRAATSARASLMLSANALILTGSTLLLGQHLAGGNRHPWLIVVYYSVLLATYALAAISIRASIGAIVAVRTSRVLFDARIPDRGAFHWGDTVKRDPSAADFTATFMATTIESYLEQGLAELYTGIRQHALRYGKLRRAARIFQYSVGTFIALLALTLLSRS